MAERRMFHASIVESDAFLDLPIGTQALYFHLGMHADDDGFVNGPRQIARKLRRPPRELQLLINTGFLLEFDGIVVIKHWRVANYLRTDRMKPLNYEHIAEQLYVASNREYSLQPQGFSPTLLEIRQPFLTTKCPPNIREDKIKEDKINQDNTNVAPCEEGPISETLRYIRYLQEHPLSDQHD